MTVEKCMKAFLEHKKKLDDVEREGRESTSEETYDKEFTKLRETSLSYKTDNIYPSTEGERSCNTAKNRYKDIVPFDHSRVRLAGLKEGSTSDYINANFIRGAVGDQLYIAAQGPMPKTVNDFWQMLWENNVRVMFMACREYEGEPPKLKCQRYWPNSTTEEITFGEIKVTLELEETTSYKEHLIRHMIATVGDESRQIVQLHYQEWPDKGVPRCIPGILDLIETLRKHQPLNAKVTPPILVHCSAGCGRTGTILVIDFVHSLLKCGKLPDDFKLYDVVAEMRRQRMAIVQSLEQYVFVHEALAELFGRQLELISKRSYENVDARALKPKLQPSVRTSPKVKSEAVPGLVYGTVGKKGANSELKTLAKANAQASEEKRSEYAYADPYQSDKWSLQALARGQVSPESAYASIDETLPQTQWIDSTYSEVGFDGHPSKNDSCEPGAPKIPPKHYGPGEGSKEEVNGSSQQPTNTGLLSLFFGPTLKQPSKPVVISGPYEIPVITFRGVVISYPHRVGKPHGKRPVKMSSMSTVH